MTYKELKNKLEGFSERELSQSAVFYFDSEFFPIGEAHITYRELKNKLKDFSEEQLSQDIVFCLT